MEVTIHLVPLIDLKFFNDTQLFFLQLFFMSSIETGQLLKQFHGNTSHVHSVFIQKCPDGEAILLNTSTSGNIRIWDLETGW